MSNEPENGALAASHAIHENVKAHSAKRQQEEAQRPAERPAHVSHPHFRILADQLAKRGNGR